MLNQSDLVKKIARKREKCDDTIDSIHPEDFPIKNRERSKRI